MIFVFEESPNSRVIWDYFNENFGQMLAPVGVLKACALYSARLPNRFNLFCVAPVGQFKSATSIIVQQFFPKTYYIDMGSDFTIHAIQSHYGKKIDRKCLMVNDATLLFSTKEKRAKERLINALAELSSEGYYKYSERQSKFELYGRISIIMNMSLESYKHNRGKLFESTFLDRFLKVFYKMPPKELVNYCRMYFNKKELKVGESKVEKLPKRLTRRCDISEDYREVLVGFSKDISAISLTSLTRTEEQILALAKSHACLNGRAEVDDDDIDFVRSIISFCSDPISPNQEKIVRLYMQGRSYKDICLLLNMDYKTYKPYVSRVIQTAKLRGIV